MPDGAVGCPFWQFFSSMSTCQTGESSSNCKYDLMLPGVKRAPGGELEDKKAKESLDVHLLTLFVYLAILAICTANSLIKSLLNSVRLINKTPKRP